MGKMVSSGGRGCFQCHWINGCGRIKGRGQGGRTSSVLDMTSDCLMTGSSAAGPKVLRNTVKKAIQLRWNALMWGSLKLYSRIVVDLCSESTGRLNTGAGVSVFVAIVNTCSRMLAKVEL